MVKGSAFLVSALLLSLASLAAAASCTVNGEDVPCDQFWEGYGWFFGAMGVFWAVGMVIVLVGTVFWVWMLVDCANRDFKDKTKWIIILALTSMFGALVYYLLIKRKKAAN
jgi:hypothetical protein